MDSTFSIPHKRESTLIKSVEIKIRINLCNLPPIVFI